MKNKHVYTALTIALVNLLTLKLYATNDLTLYIHPRYVVFTVLASALCLLLMLSALIRRYRTLSYIDVNHRPSLLSLLLCLLVIFGMILPPKPLMSDSLAQRLTDTTGQVVAECKSVEQDVTLRSLREIGQLIATCDDPILYRDQEVEVDGFVYDVSENHMTIARYTVSCCAVDATPTLVRVKTNDKGSSYDRDQWVRVKGALQPDKTLSGLSSVVEARVVTSINEPQNPYEFLSF